MTESYIIPKPPAGLKAAGKRLWTAGVTAWEFRPDEVVVLESACRLVDDLVRLEHELRTAPTMVAGSMGQPRPSPLFAEVRNSRLALAKLLQQLGLEEDSAKASSRSADGRALARARWGTR